MREFFRKYKEEHGVVYTARYREKRNANAKKYNVRRLQSDGVSRRCEFCAGSFLARNDSYRFCSKSCKSKATRRTCPASRIRVVDCAGGCGQLATRHGVSYRGVWRCESCWVPRRTFVAGNCVRCHKPFVILGQATNRYCSEECGKSKKRRTRKTRERKAFVALVSRQYIFERDGWRCQICKRKVRRDVDVSHRLAPTLDHIIPLADGGTHEPSNVQCAHFRCNSVKGDRHANDQLRLIG
jgi:hypothetical protein